MGPVEGNRYDTSVAAEIMVAKYAYHLPVYRQQDCFTSHGWTPARRLWINHVLDCKMRSRVRSTLKKQEVFKWKKCMEDFVHGQVARSTLLNVLEAAAQLIGPLVSHLREVVRADPIKRYR
jgi:hypothetical protein